MPIGSIAAARRRASGSVGAAPSSTQWRLYFPQGNTGGVSSRVEFKEIEMRASSGGADQTSGGTATASGTSAGTPADAFDGNTLTSWTSFDQGINAWIQYTFASAVSVLELYMLTQSSTRSPVQILLQYYDGSNWITVYTSPVWTSGDWGTATKTITFTLPSFSVNPSITNTSGFTPGAVGDTLTFSAGTYSGSPEVTYAKKNNGSTFDTTIGNYVLVSGDSGDTISFEVTLSNAAGSVTATSAGIGPIAASPTYTMLNTLVDSSGNTLVDSSGNPINDYSRTA